MTAPLLILLVALGQGAGYAPTRMGTAPLEQERENRVQRLGKQLRCPVCQGVSIADSPSSMARAQLDKVRELVAEGKSDQEIYDFFVARYGEWILMEPTKEGLNSVLWVGPVLLLLFGVSLVVMLSRRQRGAVSDTAFPGTPQPSAPSGATPVAPKAEAPAPAPVAEDDPFLAQVRADLEK